MWVWVHVVCYICAHETPELPRVSLFVPYMGGGVSLDDMVCSSSSGFTEYGDVDRVVGAGCGVVLCFCYLTEACVEVCEFFFATVVVIMSVSYQRPRSEAADRRVCRGECDIHECAPVHHSTCAGVRLVIVGNSSVGFNFPNVN